MWAALSRTRGLLHATSAGGPRFDCRARHLAARLGGCEAATGVGSARGRGENDRRGGGGGSGEEVRPPPRGVGIKPQAARRLGRCEPRGEGRLRAAPHPQAYPARGYRRRPEAPAGPRAQPAAAAQGHAALGWHHEPRLGWSRTATSSHEREVNAARLEPPRFQAGSTIPASTIPWSTLPGSTLPWSTLPESTLPWSTLPWSTLPGSTLPGSTLPWSTLPAEACSTSRLSAPQRDLARSPSPMDPDPRGLTPPRPDLHRGHPACQAAPPRPTAPRGGPRARASPWPGDGGRRLVASSAGRREEDKDGGGEETWGAALRAAVDAGPRAGPASAARGDGEGPGAEEAATELARCYAALGPAGRRALLRALARDPHGVDHEAAATLAARVAHMQGEGTRDPATLLQAEERLRQALAPRYKHLLVRLSRLEGGVKLLVDMRADALAAIAARDAADGPHLKELAMVLKALLSEWFSIGLLHLERVTWQSPCDMLQKIAQYEAVHPVRHWTDMRRRVGPYRRCFVFTHAAMPREPLVVLHVALTDTISSDIRSIVRESPTAATPAPAGIVAPPEDAGRVRAAVFYSISATQRGLQGIDLGHHLIKHVVRHLQAEFPSTLRDFSSLSPIPGFTRWLAGVLASHDPRPLTSAAPLPRSPSSDTEGDAAAAAAALPPFLLPDEAAKLEALTGLPAVSALRAALSRSHSCPDDSDEDGGGGGGGGGTTDGAGAAALDWWRRADLREAMRAPLTRLCARYLVGERRRGRALDPVAHFHLRNGAEAWRLNWMADVSPRALRASAGLMANYRYWPERTVRNAADYERHGRAPASADVATLAAAAAAAAAGHDDASKL
ncbi:malonyl-CoA decarboxylase, mitochondrial [Petromyzon marinus]|uniref:malonyl-CoA decarboxylase, mitochondrial n=1 Tax=Petromyzon marinus TaxID=7757 RepID=UPI003F6F9B13